MERSIFEISTLVFLEKQRRRGVMKFIFAITLLFMGVPIDPPRSFKETPVVYPTETIGSPVLPVEPAPPRIIPKLVRTGFQTSRSVAIDTLVIHSSYNKTGGDEYSVERILKIYAHYQVSAHYLIDRQGNIYQLVRDTDTSYHAGPSRMPDGRTSVNHFSLGIELFNKPGDQYTEAQYQALIQLVDYLKHRYPITAVVGHGQIAPTRKSDPWNFDWGRLQVT
jgi:hypothetical protein